MPRRAIRSANCHREIADSSVALPKDRMPCAYNERASSQRRRSSASPAGKRRLRATESETVSVMLIVLLRVYVVGASICNAGSPASTGAPEAGPPEKKRRALGGKARPVWSAEIRISPPDQVVKSGYILNFLHSYDVVRHGKVASRGKFQERRQRDGAPAAVEESAPPALSLIRSEDGRLSE